MARWWESLLRMLRVWDSLIVYMEEIIKKKLFLEKKKKQKDRPFEDDRKKAEFEKLDCKKN